MGNESVRADAEAFYESRGIAGEPPEYLKPQIGFGSPPGCALVYAPFALLPWEVAIRAWAAFLTAMVVACGTLVWTFDGRGTRDAWTAGAWAAILALIHPLTQLSISLGQTGLLICGCVALGQWAIRRGHPRLGAVAWSLVTIKPHFAIPFIALAWVLGGWRRFRDLVVALAAVTLAGFAAARCNPVMFLAHFREIDRYTGQFANSVASDLVVGWSRILYVLGGPRVELSASTTLASYLVWGVLLGARAAPWRRGPRPSPAYWLAAAAVGTLVCTQCHTYDLVLLTLLIPHLLWLWDRGCRGDVALLAALLALAALPRMAVLPIVQGLHLDPRPADILLSYRAFVPVAIALYLLVRGGQPGTATETAAAPAQRVT